jgi:hypothetical protein
VRLTTRISTDHRNLEDLELEDTLDGITHILPSIKPYLSVNTQRETDNRHTLKSCPRATKPTNVSDHSISKSHSNYCKQTTYPVTRPLPCRSKCGPRNNEWSCPGQDLPQCEMRRFLLHEPKQVMHVELDDSSNVGCVRGEGVEGEAAVA